MNEYVSAHLKANWIKETLGEPISKAYAVARRAIRRDEVSSSPTSATWSLYDPLRFVDGLWSRLQLGRFFSNDVDIVLKELDEVVHELLEENGYSKAVRIREELIKWKCRLLDESKELNEKLLLLKKKEQEILCRRKSIAEQLYNVRNVLNIPREHIKVKDEDIDL